MPKKTMHYRAFEKMLKSKEPEALTESFEQASLADLVKDRLKLILGVSKTRTA